MMHVVTHQMPFCQPRPRSQRTRLVARWFGLSPAPYLQPQDPIPTINLDRNLPTRGEILLITGASGSGKSSLLRAIRRSLPPGTSIDLNRIHIPALPIVDCFGPMRTPHVLKLLSRVGLSEAWTYLRTPDELSEGQRWRLRLAIGLNAIHRRPSAILIADEFAALLDRVTAAVIARALRRTLTTLNGRAIIATSQADLTEALVPDRIVRCDFGIIRVMREP